MVDEGTGRGDAFLVNGVDQQPRPARFRRLSSHSDLLRFRLAQEYAFNSAGQILDRGILISQDEILTAIGDPKSLGHQAYSVRY
ncbi:hypothetical protein [Streptomyces sp. NPDC093544]|uniref:hypothetical protein n=1 Tax=Streptomyces sp. NPDC093544 TaxID=3155200 RepID=UPI00341C69FB